MLPTTGFFKDIECPFLEDNCDRPYCHFRHRKKNAESCDSPKQEPSTETIAEVPTYNPTPKSQLANSRNHSHIPIQYVPDMARLPERSSRKLSTQLPIYNPTPLSLLSTTNKVNTDKTEAENDGDRYSNVVVNFSNKEYNPNEPLRPKEDIDFEDLSNEFDMIDEIIHDFDEEEHDEKAVDIEIKETETTSSDAHPESSKTPIIEVEKKDYKDQSVSSQEKKSRHSEKNNKQNSEKHKKIHKDKHSKEKSSSHDKKDKYRSSKHKHKEKDKHRSSSKHEKNDKHKSDHSKKHKEKERDNNKKHKSSGSTSKRNTVIKETKEKYTTGTESDNDEDLGNDLCDPETDYDSEDDTMQECYKIFTEYKPEQPNILPIPKAENREVITNEFNPIKKRVAHEKAESIIPKIPRITPKTTANPGNVMFNRFKVARQMQANNEQNNIINEIEREMVQRNLKPDARPAAKVKQPVKVAQNLKAGIVKKNIVPSNQPSMQSTSLVDDILAGNAKPKRIAPVQNVMSLQRAKARIDELARQKAANTIKKTLPQTVAKGSSRTAHVPDISLSDIPDVLQAEKSKLPVNVRTRYLTMIADECLKLYLLKEDAYQRALNEEFKCYERCKVLITYRNSAVLSINRLRKEVQEREKLGLGPIASGDKVAGDQNSELKGKKFYENIQHFLMTEEELVLHGYPRESSVPGRAVISNQKQSKVSNLRDNERVCVRCSKVYYVDKDGLPLNDQECMYHPLKKRTLRGERIYLCCKSSDDAGCATSHTHVTEMFNEAELEGFQTTMEPEYEEDPRSYAVYALDCEMCYTTKGLELTRVTVVDTDCKTVYESLVKPLNPIIDYNTRFSGITKEQMDRTSTSILQVQANILHLCNSKTILIGHSLESDMKALKIVHSSVIDTSVMFPHKLGLPHKRALRNLANEYLSKIIQNDVSGHDSAEDALTCMELVIWKVKEDLKVKGIKAT